MSKIIVIATKQLTLNQHTHTLTCILGLTVEKHAAIVHAGCCAIVRIYIKHICTFVLYIWVLRTQIALINGRRVHAHSQKSILALLWRRLCKSSKIFKEEKKKRVLQPVFYCRHIHLYVCRCVQLCAVINTFPFELSVCTNLTWLIILLYELQ